MGVLFGNVKLNIERVTFPPPFHFPELVLLVVLVVVLVLLLLEVVKGEARPKVKQNVYLIFLRLLSPYVFFQHISGTWLRRQSGLAVRREVIVRLPGYS